MASSLRLLSPRANLVSRTLSSPLIRQCYAAKVIATSAPFQPSRRHYASESDQVFNKGVATKTMATPEPQPNARPTLPEFDLSENVILVTGGARGLGLCMAEAFLQSGATVYALDRLPENERSEEFQQIADRAKNEWGSELQYRQIDVRDNEDLNTTIAEIADKHQRIDGLLAAAGIQQETPALEYTHADANRMFEVNITGVFMTAQAVARQMIKYNKAKNIQGSMAFIASMSATVANRGLICPAYNASKAGVVQLARNLASEWGEHGIRVNTISPGYIVTAMVENLFKTHPERRSEWATQNMLGKLSRPEDYRAIGVWMLGKGSGFLTGTDVRIDGGHAAW